MMSDRSKGELFDEDSESEELTRDEDELRVNSEYAKRFEVRQRIPAC
jgi:hypothetical protein